MTRPRQVALPGDPAADVPEWWQRANRLRRIPFVVAAVIAILLIRSFANSQPPALETSCTTPDFALSSYYVSGHQQLQWAATGPPGTRFSIAVGATLARLTPSGLLQPIPVTDVDPDYVRVTQPRVIGEDCKLDGTLGVILPPGKFRAGFFVIDDDAEPGSMVDATTSKAVTITE
jgi:hypothetical protein